jgi:hypothetical protein
LRRRRKTENEKKYLPQKTELVGIESLQDFVELCLWSAYIRKERSVSALIMASPERAKTEIMKKYRLNKGVACFDDATAFGIYMEEAQRIHSKELKTILFPDLTTPLQRKHHTVNTLLSFLNSIIEEGIVRVSTFYTYSSFGGIHRPRDVTGLRVNMIAGITTSSFWSKKRTMEKIGFITRIVPFSYNYNLGLLKKIFKSIMDEKHINKAVSEIKLNFPSEEKAVRIPLKIDIKLNRIRKRLVKSISEEYKNRGFNITGIRLFKNIRTLTKACALREGRKIVSKYDLQRIEHLSQYMNFEENPLEPVPF